VVLAELQSPSSVFSARPFSNKTPRRLLMSARPPAVERLANPEAVLTRGDLVELGLERRAVDAVFRACPVVVLPGYSRPMIRVADYLELVERSTYRGDRVRA
jgi:hypothetical protein